MATRMKFKTRKLKRQREAAERQAEFEKLTAAEKNVRQFGKARGKYL